MGCLPSYLLDRNGTSLRYDHGADVSRRSSSLMSGLPKGSPFSPPNFEMSQNQESRKFENYEDRILLALQALSKHSFELQKFNFIIGDISVEQSKDITAIP